MRTRVIWSLSAICLLAVGVMLYFAYRRVPGVYRQENACAHINVSGTHGVDWCVDGVVFGTDTMTVWCSWRARGIPAQKGSDASNRNMFLTYGFGNRLDHISTSGFAKDGGAMNQDNVRMGSYTFPAPRRGPYRFTFRDDDQHVTIPNIRLDRSRYTGSAISASLLNATEVIISREESGLGGGSSTHGTLTRLNGEAFESVVRLLAEAPVLPGPYTANINHTDDYPQLSIRVKTPTGEFLFYSESQGEGHVPWGVNVNGASCIVPSDTPERAIDAAAPYLQTKTWKFGAAR